MTLDAEKQKKIKDDLYEKARAFAQEAHMQTQLPLRLLMFSLSVELLARAALAKIHPLLLCGGEKHDDRRNAIIALLNGERGNKNARSIPTVEVMQRFAMLYPEAWDNDTRDAFTHLKDARNMDLHTGDDPWTIISSAKWHEYFYLLARQGTTALGVSLEDFLADEVTTANEYLQAREAGIETNIKEVLGRAKGRFDKATPEQKESLLGAAARKIEQILRDAPGDTRACPVCSHTGVLFSKILSASPPRIEDGAIFQDERRLPIRFICPVCELNLEGNPMLRHVGLGEIDLHPTEVSPFEFLGISGEMIREHVDPVDLLSSDDREALREGHSIRQAYEDIEYQAWKDRR